jgi:ATP-dependent Clp protease protease subunit
MEARKARATDIEIQAREIVKLRSQINEIFADRTGQSLSVIEEALERDRFMSPEEAKEFGLIDEVVTIRPKALDLVVKNAKS